MHIIKHINNQIPEPPHASKTNNYTRSWKQQGKHKQVGNLKN